MAHISSVHFLSSQQPQKGKETTTWKLQKKVREFLDIVESYYNGNLSLQYSISLLKSSLSVQSSSLELHSLALTELRSIEEHIQTPNRISLWVYLTIILKSQEPLQSHRQEYIKLMASAFRNYKDIQQDEVKSLVDFAFYVKHKLEKTELFDLSHSEYTFIKYYCSSLSRLKVIIDNLKNTAPFDTSETSYKKKYLHTVVAIFTHFLEQCEERDLKGLFLYIHKKILIYPSITPYLVSQLKESTPLSYFTRRVYHLIAFLKKHNEPIDEHFPYCVLTNKRALSLIDNLEEKFSPNGSVKGDIFSLSCRVSLFLQDCKASTLNITVLRANLLPNSNKAVTQVTLKQCNWLERRQMLLSRIRIRD